MRTVGDWVRHCEAAMEAAEIWFGHGTDNALDEAAWLVLHTLGQRLDGEFDDWDRPVTDSEASAIQTLLAERLGTRQPLAYLIGEAWFCGLSFEVTPEVLVPRSPIAALVADRFQPWVEPDRVHRALDLCTGSGCIAIAMAVYFPAARIDAADISQAALDVASRNAQRHAVDDRVALIASDGFDALAGRVYELIVSNPPYVPEGDGERLAPEYRAEPQLGLISGADGLDLPLRILLQCPDYLSRDGVLVLEVGESAERLQQGLPEVPFTWLEFEHGGAGVLTLTRTELLAARPAIRAWIQRR